MVARSQQKRSSLGRNTEILVAKSFTELWADLERRVQERPLKPPLRPLVGEAYEAVIARPYDVPRITTALEALLAYLASGEGRTHAHCVAVDSFFCLAEGWERDWEDEPEELADILGDMGGALHDTIRTPKMAENFDSTPEQLLDRLRAFRRRAVAP
jgi:hypothetical protein